MEQQTRVHEICDKKTKSLDNRIFSARVMVMIISDQNYIIVLCTGGSIFF